MVGTIRTILIAIKGGKSKLINAYEHVNIWHRD